MGSEMSPWAQRATFGLKVSVVLTLDLWKGRVAGGESLPNRQMAATAVIIGGAAASYGGPRIDSTYKARSTACAQETLRQLGAHLAVGGGVEGSPCTESKV